MSSKAPAVLFLTEVSPGSRAVVGGKALQLAELARGGFPVPRGIIVTADADAIADEVLGALERIAEPGATFAVRSSGVAEDGVEASFAGQFLSLLNVPGPDVPAAIEQVRRSAATERAAAYGGSQAAIAVLIQAMVPATAAGVAFTADPISGDRGTTIVTAVRGLAEALVGGELDGEEWVIRQGRATLRGATQGLLDPALAGAVAVLAHRVADTVGRPQDIEWVFDGEALHLLQARPMTGLPAAHSWDSPARGFYSRSFRLGEWISEPVTPLFESWLLSRMEEGLHATHRAWVGQIAPRPFHVIVNGWYFYSLNFLPLSLRAVGRSLPHILSRVIRSPRRVSAMIPPTARFGARLYETEWRDELLPRYLAAIRKAEARLEAASPSELVSLIDELAGLAGEYFASVAVVAGYAYKAEMPLVSFHRRHVAPRTGGSHLPLLAGLAAPAPQPAHAVFSLDWWYATSGEGVAAPAITDGGVRRQLVTERKAAESSARGALTSSPRRLAKFNDLLGEAQRAALVREEQLGHFTRPWPVMRRGLRRLGEYLANAGVVSDADDVYFLNRAEVASAIIQSGLGGPSLTQRTADRRDARRSAARLVPPMTVGRAPWLVAKLLAMGPELMGAASASTPALLRGTAASPGRATGPVRVIRDPGEGAALQPGDILVAPLTAPAWTPLFAVAAAVVTDIGSPLAHASIIAREYGIPAVVGCGDATLRLKDGQVVTVDGTAGLVE